MSISGFSKSTFNRKMYTMVWPYLFRRKTRNWISRRLVDFIRCLSGEFESASHDECICQRMEDGKELFMFVLLDEILRKGIQFLRTNYHSKWAWYGVPQPPSFDRCIRHVKKIQTRQPSVSSNPLAAEKFNSAFSAGIYHGQRTFYIGVYSLLFLQN